MFKQWLQLTLKDLYLSAVSFQLNEPSLLAKKVRSSLSQILQFVLTIYKSTFENRLACFHEQGNITLNSQ